MITRFAAALAGSNATKISACGICRINSELFQAANFRSLRISRILSRSSNSKFSSALNWAYTRSTSAESPTIATLGSSSATAELQSPADTTITNSCFTECFMPLTWESTTEFFPPAKPARRIFRLLPDRRPPARH